MDDQVAGSTVRSPAGGSRIALVVGVLCVHLFRGGNDTAAEVKRGLRPRTPRNGCL